MHIPNSTLISIFLLHFACCLFMTAMIWRIQLVSYPRLLQLPSTDFRARHRRHVWITTFTVVPIMLLELASGAVLLAHHPSRFLIPSALLLAIVISTVFIQSLQHLRLLHGWDEWHLRRLITWNWTRTVLWTIRSLWLGVLLLAAT